MIFINDPEAYKRILMQHETFQKPKSFQLFVQELLGIGLVTSYGERWKFQRKFLTPYFHFQSLKQVMPMFHNLVKKMIDDLCDAIQEDESRVVTVTMKDFNHLTLRVVICALLDETKFDTSAICTFYDECLDRLRPYGRMRQLIGPIWKYAPCSTGYGYTKCHHRLDRKIQEVISECRLRMKDKNFTANNMVEAMVAERRFSDSDIIDEIKTVLFAGHDTTANTMGWMLYAIGTHPETRSKLLTELSEVVNDSDLELNQNVIGKLPYAQAILKETLRLYPPVGVLARQLGEDITVDGYKIRKGCDVRLMIQATHMDEANFSSPSQFIPERWIKGSETYSKDEEKERHPYAYIPFSAGPRNCIGQKFAQLEAITLICMFVSKLNFEVMDPENVFRRFHGTVTPANLKLRVSKRRQ